jgi:hypothetical protein
MGDLLQNLPDRHREVSVRLAQLAALIVSEQSRSPELLPLNQGPTSYRRGTPGSTKPVKRCPSSFDKHRLESVSGRRSNYLLP